MSQVRAGFIPLFLFFFFLAVGPAGAFDDTWFASSFDGEGTIEEAGSMGASSSADWWVNSGGRLIFSGGVGSTIQGGLPAGDQWHTAYAQSNPVDTDDGTHPQNIFRLVNRHQWKDFTQQARFLIRGTNLSDSPNRAEHNGILFFERYQSGASLYYAGLRVDGAAVIKRKLDGAYTTLAYRKIYPGTYDKASAPNLLTANQWIGLRTIVADAAGGGVTIRLDVDEPSLGAGWTPVLEATDTGASGGAILEAGYAGIRTDFMDVEFDDYAATPLGEPPTTTPTPTQTPAPTRTSTPAPTATPPFTPTPTPTGRVVTIGGKQFRIPW